MKTEPDNASGGSIDGNTGGRTAGLKPVAFLSGFSTITALSTNESIVRFVTAALFSLFFTTVQAGDFEDGMAAYERQDYATALAKWRSAAQRGNRSAQALIGTMYLEGEGVAQNYKEAVRWYKLAAQQGDTLGQFSLGFMYANGQGVAQDYREAVRWYQQAAQQGDAAAQGNLGRMYEKGQGVAQDYKEAVRLYRLAAKQNNYKAQANLGAMYYAGKGVLQDYVRAHMWFNIAAIGGDNETANNRDLLARTMTAQQIEKAQRMARECMDRNFTKCD